MFWKIDFSCWVPMADVPLAPVVSPALLSLWVCVEIRCGHVFLQSSSLFKTLDLIVFYSYICCANSLPF